MEPLETVTHSFIVKIWLEQSSDSTHDVVWRGHITHIPSGNRAYVANLVSIIIFLLPYLRLLGVKTSLRWRIVRWLMRGQTS